MPGQRILTLPEKNLYQELKYNMGYSDAIIATALLIEELREIRKVLERLEKRFSFP